MDDSNLFSHPDAPEYVASGHASGKPVENPTFSDRPDAETNGVTKRLLSQSRPVN
jgi:hypothetical protein